MPVTTPPALSDIPAFPALSERAAGTYNANAYACLNHWASTGGPQLEALAGNVFDNATEAAADAVATAADRVQTGLDKVATAADRVQTGLDKVATAADRVQTGLDSAASAASAVAADASADAAAASAASIAGGPVASVNGMTGVVTGLATASDVSTAVSNERAATATLSNKTVEAGTFTNGYTEEVFAVSGTTPALSPTNGSIQTWTLSANSTPTAGTWADGQSLTLGIDDGTAYTITWPTVTWTTTPATPPALATSGYTWVLLWKVGGTLYGKY